jgi:hypothetical protein
MSLLSMIDTYIDGIDVTSVKLTLGKFTFKDFEIPAHIAFPAKQQTVIHKLVGGKRVIDVLGVDYDPITWSGIITGKKAGDRVRMLETMRDTGAIVTMTLDSYSFDVVVTSFVPTFEFIYRRPYTIELAVVKRNDAPVQVDALTGALNALINSDIGKSLGLAGVINVSSITDAVTTVQAAVAKIQSFASATSSAVQSVMAPIAAAKSIIHSVIRETEQALNEITTLGGMVPGNPVSKTINNVLTQADGLTSLTALYNLHNTLTRTEKNVSAGQAADGLRTVTITGGTLYQVASQQYGDPTLWTSIASANNLTDPQLTGINTLIIPANPAGDDFE